MSNENQNQTKYYNLHINGVGFLNRVRMIEPKKGQPYMAVDVTLQEGAYTKGNYDEVNETRLSCRVSGTIAQQILTDNVLNDSDVVTNAKDFRQNSTIRAVVKLAGLKEEEFTYSEGHPKAGSIGHSLRSRVLTISHLYIDGNEVDLTGYGETESDTADASAEAEVAEADVEAATVEGELVEPDDRLVA